MTFLFDTMTCRIHKLNIDLFHFLIKLSMFIEGLGTRLVVTHALLAMLELWEILLGLQNKFIIATVCSMTSW